MFFGSALVVPVMPQFPRQDQCTGTLLVNGAAGEPRTFYASGRRGGVEMRLEITHVSILCLFDGP